LANILHGKFDNIFVIMLGPFIDEMFRILEYECFTYTLQAQGR